MSAARMRRLRVAGFALVGCLALGLTGASSALAETKEFKYTGTEQEFKVPTGVTSVHVMATGGAGGGGGSFNNESGGAGGLGAIVSGDLAVSPAQVLYVEVGGKGEFGSGGFNGGGVGASFEGGGGAGASDVRGVSRTESATTLPSRLIVAAGGGGGGEGFCQTGAGGAGGSAEESGHAGTGCSGFGGGGGAGTSTKGGAGGSTVEEAMGEEGALGKGGAGGHIGGGGGGGGVYGGGGGGGGFAAGGGGGGSNLVPKGGTFVGTAKAGEAGSVTITYQKPTTLTTSLSGEGKKGEKITVKEGEAVTDQATLSGENAATATGTATYNVYGDSGCTKLLGTVSSAVSGGKSETSPLTFVEAGTYYWQVSYSGDENNQGSEDKCGAEVLTVTAKPSTSTCGKTTVGKTKDGLVANWKRVNACVVPFSATVSELSVYLSPTTHSGQQLIKGVFYADSKGKPGALLGTTSKFTFTSKDPPGWYHLVFPEPLKVAAGNYWIGLITGATQYIAAEYFDSVANAEDYNTNNYISGPSNPFGSFKTTNEEMSLYATFTPEVHGCAGIQRNTIC